MAECGPLGPSGVRAHTGSAPRRPVGVDACTTLGPLVQPGRGTVRPHTNMGHRSRLLAFVAGILLALLTCLPGPASAASAASAHRATAVTCKAPAKRVLARASKAKK